MTIYWKSITSSALRRRGQCVLRRKRPYGDESRINPAHATAIYYKFLKHQLFATQVQRPLSNVECRLTLIENPDPTCYALLSSISDVISYQMHSIILPQMPWKQTAAAAATAAFDLLTFTSMDFLHTKANFLSLDQTFSLSHLHRGSPIHREVTSDDIHKIVYT